MNENQLLISLIKWHLENREMGFASDEEQLLMLHIKEKLEWGYVLREPGMSQGLKHSMQLAGIAYAMNTFNKINGE